MPQFPKVRNDLAREFIAEFLGTFILILLGDGAVAQMVLTKGSTVSSSYISVNFGYAMAVAFGVYVSGGVSGGHINPAVTLTMAILGRLKGIKVPVYMAGQYLGAFMGAAVVFGVYHDLISKVDPNLTLTEGIFATYPFAMANPIKTGYLLFDQIVGTAILLFLVMSLLDEKNSAPHKGLTPLLVGLIVLAIGLSFGIQTGYAINPARDFGPRIFTAMAGYEGVFSAGHYYFWIPIVGPHLGALIGASLYYFLIEHHMPGEEPRKYIVNPSHPKQDEERLTTV